VGSGAQSDGTKESEPTEQGKLSRRNRENSSGRKATDWPNGGGSVGYIPDGMVGCVGRTGKVKRGSDGTTHFPSEEAPGRERWQEDSEPERTSNASHGTTEEPTALHGPARPALSVRMVMMLVRPRMVERVVVVLVVVRRGNARRLAREPPLAPEVLA
jgi:hypothetical protein